MAYEQQGDFHVLNHIRGRNFSLHASIVTTTSGDLALDSGSTSNFFFDGSVSGQTVTLPDATDDCIFVSHEYRFFNESTENITIRDFANTTLATLLPNASIRFYLKDKTDPGIWVDDKIQLSQVLVDLNNIAGVSGFDAQSFIEDYLSKAGLPVVNEVPGGVIDCDNLTFTLAHEAIAGTMEPSIDGRKLTPGLDFTEAPNGLSFTMLIDPSLSSRLNSPPHESEDLLVSYKRRVIF